MVLRVFFLHLRSAAKNRSAMFLPIPNREDLIPELTRIAEGAMEDHFADDVLDRAEEYYDEALWELAEARPGWVEARAEGSQHYRVNLTSEAGGLRLECSCPYEENCKHLAAFVWLVTEEWRSALEQALGPEENARAFTDYLETLSQAELIQLLDLFAPPEFRREIALREATADTVDAAFSAVVRRVEKLLTGGPHHEPGTYEDILEERLRELLPFASLRGRAILALLRRIREDVNARTEEGELYNHYSDSHYDGDTLVGFAAGLVFAQPPEMWATFTADLLAMRRELNEYATFHGLVHQLLGAAPRVEALQAIVPVLTTPECVQSLEAWERKLLLERLRPLLTEEQLLRLLSAASDGRDLTFTVEYCRLLERREGREAALRELSGAVAGATGFTAGADEAYGYLAELSREARGAGAEREVLLSYLRFTGRVNAIQLAVARRPELAEEFRLELEPRQPATLLEYLVGEGDHAAAVGLLDRRPHLYNCLVTYDLLVRYASRYPGRARRLVYQLLDAHLPHADKRSYAEVVRAVLLLRAAGPVEEFTHVVSDIKANYRRRSNLLGMLLAAGVG